MDVLFHRLALAGTVLALAVIMLGAWVRLTDAGLGCPDWPGCYGRILPPEQSTDIAAANEAFPERPVEVGKAWREMIHRYLAAGLGLVILALGALAWRNRDDPLQPVVVPLALVGLVIFQGLLGMWTVTLLLKPLVVTAHLLGGMTTLGLLWWLALVTRPRAARLLAARRVVRVMAVPALVLVAGQIALGGWTSANYAAMACPDFPTCQAQWLPQADFGEAFVPWRGLGVDYEGGVLDGAARTAIHFTHRIGAVIVLLFVGALGLIAALRGRDRAMRVAGTAVTATLAAQLALGISVVLLGLPLLLAVAHNGTAALLVMSLVTLNYAAWRTV